MKITHRGYFTICPRPFYQRDDVKYDEMGSEYYTRRSKRKGYNEGGRPGKCRHKYAYNIKAKLRRNGMGRGMCELD